MNNETSDGGATVPCISLLGDWWVVWLMLGDDPMPMAAFSTQDLAAEWMNSRNNAVAPACYVTHGWKSPNSN